MMVSDLPGPSWTCVMNHLAWLVYGALESLLTENPQSKQATLWSPSVFVTTCYIQFPTSYIHTSYSHVRLIVKSSNFMLVALKFTKELQLQLHQKKTSPSAPEHSDHPALCPDRDVCWSQSMPSIFQKFDHLQEWKKNIFGIPSRGLTYPIWGIGKSSSKCHFWGIC